MSAPNLSRQLILEERQRVSDGAGGYSSNWNSQATHWAQVIERPGSLVGEAEVTIARVVADITVRAYPHGDPRRPKASQRFREGSRNWEIQSVVESEMNGRYLLCRVLEDARV